MDLVENYLAAVDAQLPPAMRADVIPELRDTLLTKLEEKEASLGRKPSPAETAATLKAFGHPLVIANRYRQHQQLIGPEVYPFYVVTLQVVLGIVVFLQIVLTVLGAATARDPIVLIARTWASVMPGLLGAFAIVTIVFLIIERAGGAAILMRSWSPRALSASPLSRPKQIWETLFEVAFETVFLLWWSGVIRFGDAPFVRNAPPSLIEPGPIWTTLHGPIFAVVAAGLAVNALSLLQPGRLWTIALGRIVVALASAVIMVLLIRADPLFVTAPGSEGEILESVSIWIIRGVKFAFAFAAVIWIFEALTAVSRAHRGRAPMAEC